MGQGQFAIGGAPRPRPETQEVKFYGRDGALHPASAADPAPSDPAIVALSARVDAVDAKLDLLLELIRKPAPIPVAVEVPVDQRPAGCRNRLRDEGKPYPKSGCNHCRNGGLMGCPLEKAAPQDTRPVKCRERLKDEGAKFLAGRCESCGRTIFERDYVCPHAKGA